MAVYSNFFVKSQQYLVPEDQLLRRLNKRDEQAFQWLYDQYAHVLYGVVLTSVCLPDVAKQVVEEVFVKAWNEFDQFNPKKTRLLTWLLRRARQEALRAMPKNPPGRPPEVDSEAVENLISPEQRTLLDAVYFRGQLASELTGEKSGIDTNLRERLRVVLQELKLVFTQ
ncbi:RNA polymerase sigma-70 factor, ECF subfamily [Fibrella aestuarina BUZ 2]|uniref:RNA polymerase sigma-70 factor, ECF subfamily n=1 Tax=Fibrella aestuarina BUZ 2 TaxID=1166018 RepID=I0KAL1_9BACT|nr:RNA polymerase sigma-70 factor, ECF subfamily [Fibrella aestuarina BUZ 2]